MIITKFSKKSTPELIEPELFIPYKVIVGMEPTGHYWLNLAKWLSEHHIEVVLVNPHLVKKNKENRDNTQSKSDKKDPSSSLIWSRMATMLLPVPIRKHSKNYEYLCPTVTWL